MKHGYLTCLLQEIDPNCAGMIQNLQLINIFMTWQPKIKKEITGLDEIQNPISSIWFWPAI